MRVVATVLSPHYGRYVIECTICPRRGLVELLVPRWLSDDGVFGRSGGVLGSAGLAPASVRLGLFHDPLGILGEEEPVPDQALGRLPDALHVALPIRVAFLDGKALVPG